MAWIELYVRADAAGGGDGTTEVVGGATGAWTFAEMVAANFASAATSETRINIKSGAYSQGAWTWDVGVALNPIVYRGYNVTPGDLDQATRGPDGLLVTTNFPEIECTAIWTPTNFNFLSNLIIFGSLNSSLIFSATADNWGAANCAVTNLDSTGSAQCFEADDGCCFVNCDFSCIGTLHSAVVAAGANVKVVGCRFKITQNNAFALICDSGIFYRCIFIGLATPGTTVGIRLAVVVGANSVLILGCTFYGFSVAFQTANGTQTGPPIISVDNMVTDCTEYLHATVSAADCVYIESNLRIRDVTTPRTHVVSAILGKEVTTDTGDYVSVTADDFRLIPSSPARLAGMMPKSDCGAYQSGGGSGVHSRQPRISGRSS